VSDAITFGPRPRAALVAREGVILCEPAGSDSRWETGDAWVVSNRHPLDNAVWSSLSSGHAHFAELRGRARMATLADRGSGWFLRAFADLASSGRRRRRRRRNAREAPADESRRASLEGRGFESRHPLQRSGSSECCKGLNVVSHGWSKGRAHHICIRVAH
jgi:hypothetical protein